MRTLEQTPEFADHLAGVPLREIGKRRGISHETARQTIREQGREHIVDLAGRLLVNRRTGDLEVLVIPDVSGPDFDQAVAYLIWAVNELAELGITVKLHANPIEAGIAFGLEELSASSAQEES